MGNIIEIFQFRGSRNLGPFFYLGVLAMMGSSSVIAAASCSLPTIELLASAVSEAGISQLPPPVRVYFNFLVHNNSSVPVPLVAEFFVQGSREYGALDPAQPAQAPQGSIVYQTGTAPASGSFYLTLEIDQPDAIGLRNQFRNALNDQSIDIYGRVGIQQSSNVAATVMKLNGSESESVNFIPGAITIFREVTYVDRPPPPQSTSLEPDNHTAQ